MRTLCLAAVAAALLAGCAPAPMAPTPAPATPGVPGVSATTTPGAIALTADEIKTIDELPTEEAAVAKAQMICPVSDEHLGSMGKPIKMPVGDATAYLCCDGCVEEFQKDPAKYLAKAAKR